MEPTSKKISKRARDAEVDVNSEGDDDHPSPSSSTSKLPLARAESPSPSHEDEDQLAGSSTSRKPKHVKKKAKKTKSPGIVYISRLPPGMTPQKVRHLMGRWGDVGKVYAQRPDAPSGHNPNVSQPKKQKHASANFTEAWVEFLDKSIAKTVASMLNAQVIGGKKGDRWRDDIWTMKYLSGFKWEMLGEQVAYERQAHNARLRTEIARSKTEQSEYLKNVELARVLKKREAKKVETSASGGAGAGQSAPAAAGIDSEGRAKGESKGYRQRQVVDKGKSFEGKGMDKVLGNVFG
ncbi:hypothetical protein CI109_100125 [Kwoniella shandongensis]|uniref:18S rRNA factor 2 n=1 Tax=Kwoniella shandongensis TaxID=1734106 RepID=A0A5M6BPJ3_9TREE|nr:uncharacterized protein CI109_006847 [Kwoniella shandongensis]KAA5524824.1 hypothetical protein CI109_006847 [Kwoniella shandongensis]